MQKRFGLLRSNRLVSASASGFTDEEHANETIAFFRSNFSWEASQAAENTAELIRFRARFKAKELPVIDRWIAAKVGSKLTR
jgi:hypothetical protein